MVRSAERERSVEQMCEPIYMVQRPSSWVLKNRVNVDSLSRGSGSAGNTVTWF